MKFRHGIFGRSRRLLPAYSYRAKGREEHPHSSFWKPLIFVLLTPFSLSVANPTIDSRFIPIHGDSISITQLTKNAPLFIITALSQEQAPEAMKIATLIEAIPSRSETTSWIINLSFDHSFATQRFINGFPRNHKSRMGRIEGNVNPDQLPLILLSSEGNILWSSPGYPSDSQWRQAIEIHQEAKSN